MTLKASDLVGPEHMFEPTRMNPNRCSKCGLEKDSSIHYMVRSDEFYQDDYERLFNSSNVAAEMPELSQYAQPDGPCSCLQHRVENCSECFGVKQTPKAYMAFPAGFNPTYSKTQQSFKVSPAQVQYELSECARMKEIFNKVEDKLVDIFEIYVDSEVFEAA
jgi:hypothetical protein